MEWRLDEAMLLVASNVTTTEINNFDTFLMAVSANSYSRGRAFQNVVSRKSPRGRYRWTSLFQMPRGEI